MDPAVTYGDGNSSSSSSAAAAAAKGWTDTAAEALKAGKLAQIQLPPALLRELPLSPAVPVVGASQEASVEALQATGRWGEAVVCQYLRLQAASARSLLVVDWVNETGESRLPYDIRVHDVEEGEVYYVEVKATRAESKTFFEVSPAELAFCQQQGDRHHVYRLTGAAGSSAAPPQIVLRLVNPAELRAQHIINVCIVL